MERSLLKSSEGLITPRHILECLSQSLGTPDISSHTSICNPSLEEPAPGLFTLKHSYLRSLPKAYMTVFNLLCFYSSSISVTCCCINNFNNACINLIYIMLRWSLMYLGTGMSKFLKMSELMLQGLLNEGVSSQTSFRLEERLHGSPFTFSLYEFIFHFLEAEQSFFRFPRSFSEIH